MTFRNSVMKLYERCTITDLDPMECDAAHIVPQYVCTAINPDLIQNPFNGLLLCKNIHVTFDQHHWTFDVYDWEPDPDPNWIRIRRLITLGKNNLYIDQYAHPLVPYRIPKQSLRYLHVHYHVYFLKNYCNCPVSVTDYRTVMNNKTYRLRCMDNNPAPIMQPEYILRKRNQNDLTECEVLWKGYPYHQRTWESRISALPVSF